MVINRAKPILKILLIPGVALFVGLVVNWSAARFFALEVYCVRAPCPTIEPAWKTEVTIFFAALAGLLTSVLVVSRGTAGAQD